MRGLNGNYQKSCLVLSHHKAISEFYVLQKMHTAFGKVKAAFNHSLKLETRVFYAYSKIKGLEKVRDFYDNEDIQY